MTAEARRSFARLRILTVMLLVVSISFIVGSVAIPNAFGVFVSLTFFSLTFGIVTVVVTVRRSRRAINPSMEELVAGRESIITETLQKVSPVDPSYRKDFRTISIVEGIGATVSRSGSVYEVQVVSEKHLLTTNVTCGVGWIVTRPGRGMVAFFSGVAEWYYPPFQDNQTESGSRLGFELKNAFSCEGYVNGMGPEYVVAPAAKIDLRLHGDIYLMILEPQTRPRRAGAERTYLSVSFGKAQANARISTVEGGLMLDLKAAGSGFEWTKLVLYRIVPGVKKVGGLTSWASVFAENLCELRVPGETESRWTSPRPSFDPTVWVFPTSLALRMMAKLWEPFGVQPRSSMFVTYPGGNFVLGDGVRATYKIRLILHPTRRREVFDETTLTME